MATRSWKYYRAKAEAYLDPNVFRGPLNEDDRFVRYARIDGWDYLGVYTAAPKTWLTAQPAALEVTEIRVEDVPRENRHLELAARRLEERLLAAATAAEEDDAALQASAELKAKGLPPTLLVAAEEDDTDTTSTTT